MNTNAIAVFCGASHSQNPLHTTAAQDLGRAIATRGKTLIYGGSNLGLMGVVASAARDNGGKVVGIIPSLFPDEVIHSQPVDELVVVRTLSERKQCIATRSDAFVALPGGIGTLDEITEMMTLNQLHIQCKPIGLLNVDHYFDPFLSQLDVMRLSGLLSTATTDTLLVAPSADALLDLIAHFSPHPATPAF